MRELPHGIADALHIDEPFPMWTLLAAGLLVWLLYRMFRVLQRRSAESVPPVGPPLMPVPSTHRIATVIEGLRRQYRRSEEYRRGCHDLAAALREHFDRGHETRESLTTLTAAEMTRQIGDSPVSRLFDLLSRLQFFRRSPSRSDFDGACDLALEVVESRDPFREAGS